MTLTHNAITTAEAAKLTGMSKSTIIRAVKEGKFPARKDDHGHLLIEPIELFTVFPPLLESHTLTAKLHTVNTHKPSDIHKSSARAHSSIDAVKSDTSKRHASESRLAVLQHELEDIRLERDNEKAERFRENQASEQTIMDLRQRLDRAEQANREKDAQLKQLEGEHNKTLATLKTLEEGWSWRGLLNWARRLFYKGIHAIKALIYGSHARGKLTKAG